jgi:PAS domain S-box-containing protein
LTNAAGGTHEAGGEVRIDEPGLRLLLEASIGPMAVHADGRWVEINSAFAQLFGYERSELVGTPVSDIIAPESIEEVRRHIAEGSEDRYEIVGLPKDGPRIVVEWHAINVVYGGRPARLVASRDITALRRDEQRYLDLVEGVEAILWEGDPTSLRFTFVSRRAEDVLGYEVSEWLTPDFWINHLHPDDRERTAQECMEAIRQVKDHELEYRMVAADGEAVWFRDLVRVRPASDGTAAQLRGVMVNVTPQKEAEERQTRLESQLRQAHKLEAIGRLAGGVAHDFNNILTAIAGNADLLLEDAPPELSEDIREIRRSADRATRLVRQLLTFAREQRSVPEVMNINDVVLEMDQMIQRLMGNIELVIDIGPNVPRVMADRGQIEQIILNLVINARDAMPRGGKLTVQTHAVEADGRWWAAASVTDTGIGMSQETVERMFDPFFTTKGKGQGTGLGLATVHGIVSQSGGKIATESTPGVGTRVQVLFPAVDEQE